jgi:SAM-dependent methyltransferase
VSRAPVLRFDPDALERAAREGAEESLPVLILRQAAAELAVAGLKGLTLRSGRNASDALLYGAMSVEEFEAVNARQRWANWRTIPRNLEGRLPDAPLRALDLCCGTGRSTQVLAWCLPAGSEILGLELSPRLTRAAAARAYRTRRGGPAAVRFRVQSVLERFRDAGGAPVPDASLDLVNSSGALGVHFDDEDLLRVAAEVRRVLKPGGLATIDAGGLGESFERTSLLFARGFELVGWARSCALDRYPQLCLRRTA